MFSLTRLKRFVSDRSGNAALVFGLSLIPVMASVGAAVDFARATNVQVALQGAADNAALAAAALTGGTRAERRREALRVFDANVAEIDDLNRVTRRVQASSDGIFTVKANGKFDTSAARLLGVNRMDVAVKAQATYSTQGTEIAFAFDITNSMGFGTSWQDATSIMEDVLESLKRNSGANDFFVSLVPFSDRVNVGSHNDRWLRGATPASWDGCTLPREQAHSGFNWAMDDDPPRGANRFEPNEDPDPTDDHDKYFCPAYEITGPTNNVDTIMNMMDRLTRGSTGRFDEGLVWAWRLLSHRWRGQWGAPNYPARFTPSTAPSENANSRRKVAVLISDGFTNIYRYEVGGDGSDPFGWNRGSPAGFEHVVHMCSRMKAQGIEVHVMHINGNDSATSYFRSCASPGAYTKVRDRATLLAAMEGLQGKSTSVRLIK